MVEVQDYFEVKYGNSLALSDLRKDETGFNYVSRTSKNNGVSAKIKKISNIDPIPAKTISVSVSGSVMESFLQLEEYYTGYHILILYPKIYLNKKQLLYYCMCLRANKYKFNFGRQANKTLKKTRDSITRRNS